MPEINFALTLLYALLASWLALYGFNALLFSALFLGLRYTSESATTRVTATPESQGLPTVAVQLPIYNERFVVERLIKAAAALDYPREKLFIQVLDDSTDDTVNLARTQVAHYKAQGLNIEHVRRPNRVGYKAGALAYGLAHTSAEFVAVFDADFVPPKNFLREVMPHFANEKIGLVQTRWGHVNPEHSWLTRAQAFMLDGHFVVEQFVRSRLNLFWNFNGSGGVWRVACINDAGGWGMDTIAEDLDLSYRAQLRGWHMKFLPHVVAPAEIPSLLVAFKRQQFRWAKGSIQCLRKFALPVLNTDASLFKKLEGLIHLSGYLVHPLMLLLVLISLPVVQSGYLSQLHLGAIGVAGFGAPVLFALAQWATTPNWKQKILYLPLIMLVGPGIAVSNSWAVIEALINRHPTLFLRTPKFQVEGQQGQHHLAYTLPIDWSTWVEIFFAVYCALTAYVCLMHSSGLAIFMGFYAAGFGYSAYLGVVQSLNVKQEHLPTKIMQEV